MPDNINDYDDLEIVEISRAEPVRLGEYSNDPVVAEREELARQSNVAYRIGDYYLTASRWPNKYTELLPENGTLT